MSTYKIDPVLEEQLKKRGMTNKLTELQGATKNTSTASNFLPSLGSTIVNAPGNILKGIDSVIDTGIPTLGNAYGGALLAKSGYVDKMQNELTRTNQDLGDKVIKQIRDPKVSDSAKAKLVNMYRDINPDIASQIPQLQVTDKEILGSSAKLAMFVALAGSSPMSPAGQVRGYVNPAVNKELLSLTNAAKNLTRAEIWATYGPKIGEAINVAKKFGPQIAYDTLLGVTYGAGNAFGKNKSIEEVKKEAVDMGALNAGLPLVGGMVLRGLSQGLKYAGEGIGGLTMKARNAAEKYALGTTLEERAIAAKTVQDEMLAINKPQQTGTQKLAEGFVKGVDWIRDIPRQMLDAGIPLNKYSRDAYLDYREGADRVNNRTKKSQLDIVDIFSKDNNILDAQKAKMTLLDQLDIARQGKETASQRLYGAATPEETVKILEQKQIEMELAHQDAGISEEVQTALDKYTDFNTKLLQEKVDHGLITQAAMDEMLTQHPNYIPHNTVVRSLDENVVMGTSGSKNPSKSGVMSSEGSTRELDDPIDTIFNRLEGHYKSLENAKLTNDLIKDDVAGVFKKEIPGMELGEQAKQEQGLSTINRWVNGTKETYYVPNDVALAVKNLDPEPLHKFVQGWGKINNVFKQLTTGLNLPFGVNNLVKDRQTAYITVSSLIKDAQKRAGISDGFMKKIGMDDKGLLDMYRDIGGSGASIFNDAKGKTGLETFEQMRKSGFATSLEGLRPDKMIENINQQMEISTRLAAFRRALEGGLSPEEAALVARDATVDFSKMGVQMKWLNQVVPFLNARVQGTANTLKAISKNPMDFARKMYYTSVVPTLMLDRHNSQFESNNLVNQEFAKNNWYIITGEEEITDSDGRKIKVPTVAGVKKGEMQQLFSAPIDEMLSRSRGNNPKTAGELAYNMLGSISPLGTGGYNPDSWYTAPIAALGPIPKIMVGMGTNIDPYTGLPIEPDVSVEGNLSPKNRYTANTKQLSKELSATIMPGLSPARLEYIIGSWGAVPKQILETANLTEGLIKGDGVRKQNNLTSDAASIPWLNNFIKQGSYIGSTPYKEGRKTEQEIKRETGDINFQNKEKANLLIDQAFKIQDPEERKIFLQTAAKNYSPDIITKAATEYKSRNAEGYLRPGMDSDVVAQFVYKELLNMQQANISDAEQKDYLQGLYKKKIISDSAAEKIKGLRQYGEYVGPISEAQTQDEKNTLIISAIYDMKNKGIKNSAASMFLSKMFNDGHITNETLPLIKNAVVEMNKQSE